MPRFEPTALPISGFSGEPVPNKFFQHEGAATTLAVLFPGLQYTCDMPLLYYPTKLLFQRGADVLQLRTDYTRVGAPERAQRLSADAEAAVRAGWQQRDYAKLVLVGKSIGTLAQAHLLASDVGAAAINIWLTPLLRQPALVEAASRATSPALFIAGTADSTYDAGALSRIRQASGAETLLIEGADHSLEIPGDFFRSLQSLGDVMRGIAGFLDWRSQ